MVDVSERSVTFARKLHGSVLPEPLAALDGATWLPLLPAPYFHCGGGTPADTPTRGGHRVAPAQVVDPTPTPILFFPEFRAA